MRRSTRYSLALAVSMLTGCAAGGTGSDPAPAHACDPGASRACACSDGGSGAQTCSDDGSAFGACACSCVPSCSGKECGSDGCGGSCGACSAGLACTSANKCDLDALGSWEVTITDGSLVDKDYNYLSAPDPNFCMDLDGASKCTGYALDTTKPTWNKKLGTATAAGLSKSWTWELVDDDSPTDPDDPICSGTSALTLEHFQAGGFTITCKDGSGLVIATVNATLKPVPR